MKLKIVVLGYVLFNLFGGVYAVDTDLAFSTELFPVGVQASARIVWWDIQEELKGQGYSFKDLTWPRTPEAPAWVDENVGDGEIDLIFFFFPSGAALGGNGILQRFLDDGNMAVTYGFITQHTAEELKQFAADNEVRSVEGPESKITPMGVRFTPSLKEVYNLTNEAGIKNKVVNPKALDLDWYLEVAFAQTANGLVDNAVFRNRRTDGRIAVFFQNQPITPWIFERTPEITRAQAKVFSEFIQNWIHEVAAVHPQGRLTTTWGHLKKE